MSIIDNETKTVRGAPLADIEDRSVGEEVFASLDLEPNRLLFVSLTSLATFTIKDAPY